MLNSLIYIKKYIRTFGLIYIMFLSFVYYFFNTIVTDFIYSNKYYSYKHFGNIYYSIKEDISIYLLFSIFIITAFFLNLFIYFSLKKINNISKDVNLYANKRYPIFLFIMIILFIDILYFYLDTLFYWRLSLFSIFYVLFLILIEIYNVSRLYDLILEEKKQLENFNNGITIIKEINKILPNNVFGERIRIILLNIENFYGKNISLAYNIKEINAPYSIELIKKNIIIENKIKEIFNLIKKYNENKEEAILKKIENIFKKIML